MAQQVQMLLLTGWKPSPDNYTAAQQQYETAQRMSPADVRVHYAMALVALQNKHLEDASAALDRALQSPRPLLPLRRMKVWLQATRNDAKGAQAAIRELAPFLAASESSAKGPEIIETTRWLGGVMAYFAGPGAGKTKDVDWETVDAELVRILAGPPLTTFQEGKDKAAKQFDALQQELAAARKTATDKNATKTENDRLANDDELKKATALRDDTQISYNQFVREHIDEQQSKSLELAGLQSDIARLNQEETRLQRAIDAEEKEKDPDKLTIRAAAQAKRTIESVKSTRAPLDERAGKLKRKLMDLHAQDVGWKKDLYQQNAAVQKLQLKAKQLAKPASQDDAATTALAAKVKSISTYADFDPQQEKSRILATYGIK